MIFTGKAGGFMAEFGKLIGDMRGIDYAPIKFKVADDLSYWSAEIPGKVVAKAEALNGPMTPSGKRVQTLNAPGSEVGPGTVATWGKAAGIIISILFHNYKELKECISEVEQIEEANVNNKKIQSLPEKEEERVDKKPSVKQICMTDWID